MVEKEKNPTISNSLKTFVHLTMLIFFRFLIIFIVYFTFLLYLKLFNFSILS